MGHILYRNQGTTELSKEASSVIIGKWKKSFCS